MLSITTQTDLELPYSYTFIYEKQTHDHKSNCIQFVTVPGTTGPNTNLAARRLKNYLFLFHSKTFISFRIKVKMCYFRQAIVFYLLNLQDGKNLTRMMLWLSFRTLSVNEKLLKVRTRSMLIITNIQDLYHVSLSPQLLPKNTDSLRQTSTRVVPKVMSNNCL